MRLLGAAGLAALALVPGHAGAASRAGVGQLDIEAVFVIGYDAKAKANVVATYADYSVTGTSASAAGPKDTAYAFRVVCLAFATKKTNDSGCMVLDANTPSVVTGAVLPESGRIRTKVPSIRGWLQADLTVTATGAPYAPPVTYGSSVTKLMIAGVEVPVGASVSAGPQILRPGSVTGTFRTSRGATFRPAALASSPLPTSLLRSQVVTVGAYADRRDVTAALHAATLAALPA